MIDTMTVLAYLLTHEPGHSTELNLRALIAASHSQQVVCTQQIESSPELAWKDVPPEANSLALIIKDAPTSKTSDKPHYYWVVYNLPVEIKGLSLGANTQINPEDEGVNSWGQRGYHAPCWGSKAHPIEIEVVALDKRFSARSKMTGEKLEQKMKSDVLARRIITE